MKIELAIRDYLTEHEISNCSPDTIRHQRRVLNCFASWLAQECEVTDTDLLQITHLRGWVAHLQKVPNKNDTSTGLRPGTVSQYAIVMLSFCHWLEREDIIEKPFTHRFKLPKAEDPFIPTYTPEE